MAIRNHPGSPINGAPTVGAALSGATTGVKLSYTVPANRQAMLRWFSVQNFTGAPTVQARVTTGGATVVLASGTTAFSGAPNMPLNAGDVVDLNVSALVAASVFDGAIGAEEFSATA